VIGGIGLRATISFIFARERNRQDETITMRLDSPHLCNAKKLVVFQPSCSIQSCNSERQISPASMKTPMRGVMAVLKIQFSRTTLK
jgi:hypothetical protein